MLSLSIIAMVSSDLISYLKNGNGSISVIQNLLYLFGNASFLYLGICFATNDLKIPKLTPHFLFAVLGLIGIYSRNESQYLSIWFIYVVVIVLIIFNILNFEKYKLKNLKKILNFIGKRTYGLFCGHFLVMISLHNFVIGGTDFPTYLILRFGYFIGSSIFFMIVLLLASIFSYISYKFLERPSIKKVKMIIEE